MNDKQSEEVIEQLKRIADALERMSPPHSDNKKRLDELAQNLKDTLKSHND